MKFNKQKQSSSRDDKKNDTSLKKNHRHQIFDKKNSPIKFKPLNQIKEQNLPQFILKKYKSTDQLHSKDKLVNIIEKQHVSRQQQGKINRKEKLRSNSSKSGSRDNSQKNIEILEIENHEIIDEKKQRESEKYQRSSKGGKSSGELRVKQSLELIPQKRQGIDLRLNSLKHSSETQMQIIKVETHAFNRDQEILDHKYLSNLKYLTAQTSELLSYSKHMLLEEQIAQTKRQMSELNIFIRKQRIDMRNHEYTKEINFTFPVQKHNDLILVKMPEKVSDHQMNRYLHMVQKIQIQSQIFTEQQQKIDHLEAYHQSLIKKYEPILSLIELKDQNEKISGSKKSIQNQSKPKLIKSKSSENLFSVKTTPIDSLLVLTSNPRTPTKKLTQSKTSQSEINFTRYQTLLQKKETLKESLQDSKANIEVKVCRLSEEITLLKRQLSLVDENIQNTQMVQTVLMREIESSKNQRQSKQMEKTIERQYQSIANERRANYEKQLQKRSIETKGFTLSLRSTKSLSPVNYISSPRPVQKTQFNQNAKPSDYLMRKTFQSVSSGKAIKVK